jgi:hypothetical protein
MGERREGGESEERKMVLALIEKYGNPHNVVHKQYEKGADYTEGVLVQGCCDQCAHEGVQQGHGSCSELPADIKDAEAKGLVGRAYKGDGWWVVVDDQFKDLFEHDPESAVGFGEDEDN